MEKLSTRTQLLTEGRRFSRESAENRRSLQKIADCCLFLTLTIAPEREVGLEGVFVKIGHFVKLQGFHTGIPRENSHIEYHLTPPQANQKEIGGLSHFLELCL